MGNDPEMQMGLCVCRLACVYVVCVIFFFFTVCKERMNRTSVCLSCVPLTSGRALPFFYQPALVSRPLRLHPRPRYYFPLAFVVLRRLCDPLALSLSLSFVLVFFFSLHGFRIVLRPNRTS